MEEFPGAVRQRSAGRCAGRSEWQSLVGGARIGASTRYFNGSACEITGLGRAYCAPRVLRLIVEPERGVAHEDRMDDSEVRTAHCRARRTRKRREVFGKVLF